ncbi:hypothetical protein AX16_001449 [Volvariella volvacea WC 439]|nr:hypothetical protein AX16_001449 [Volvariella volvacea WC 439]
MRFPSPPKHIIFLAFDRCPCPQLPSLFSFPQPTLFHSFTPSSIPLAVLPWVECDYPVEMALQNLTISHKDARISYSGFWSELGEDQLDPQLGFSSTHFSSSRLSAATFDFEGIAISVIGALNYSQSATPSLSYTIDGMVDSEFHWNSTETTPRTLYASPFLAPGRHSLIMTLMTDESAVFVQSFHVIANNTAASNSVVESAPKWRIGAIVGGTLGGLILIMLLGVFIVTYFRRKERPRTVVYTTGHMTVSLPVSKEDFTSRNYSNYGLSFTATPPASTEAFTIFPTRTETRPPGSPSGTLSSSTAQK